MEGMNGYKVCEQLRSEGITVPVIMLTAKVGDLDETDGFEVGADDYLRKPFSPSVLVARVRALLRRGQSSAEFQPNLVRGDVELDQRAMTCTFKGDGVDLTPRQFQVRDISENRPGVPLDLQLRVVDADSCAPIPDATIDVRHADAGGLYSAFSGQGDDANIDNTGQTFLRGTQMTDVDGSVMFSTIYPGWYRGRTTHIHIKVHFDNNTRVTSQLYFPDEVTAAAYATDAYRDRGPKDTLNETDDFSAANPALRMSLKEAAGSYLATHTIGIRR